MTTYLNDWCQAQKTTFYIGSNLEHLKKNQKFLNYTYV